MKKYILFLGVLIILATIPACKMNQPNSEDTVLKLESLKLERKGYEISVSLSKTYNNYEYSNWSDYIKNQYGIHIKCDYYTTSLFKSLTDVIEKAKGIIELSYNDVDNITSLAQSNKIRELSDILAKSRGYKSLPDYVKTLYTDIDGNIWALPRTVNMNTGVRYYNKSVIQKNNLSIPQTIDELYEFCVTMKRTNNISGMQYDNTNANTFTRSFKDIFHGNGCFFSGDTFSTVSYNSKYGSFEDFLLMDNGKESLMFIKNMLNQNLLSETTNSISPNKLLDTISNQEGASFYGWLYDYYGNLIKTNDFIIQPGISGLITEGYIELMSDESCFVLGENSNVSQEAFIAFIDFLYGTREGVVSSRYGIENETYAEEGNVIKIFANSAYGEFVPFLNISTINPYNYEEILDGDVVKQRDLVGAREYLLTAYEVEEKLLKYQYPLYSGITGSNNITVTTGVEAIYDYLMIQQDLSYEDFLLNYRNMVKKSGFDEHLYRANESIGGTTQFIY